MNNGLSALQIEQLLNTTKNSKTCLRNFDLSYYTISNLLEDRNNEKVIIAYINRLLKSSPNDDVYLHLMHIISGISSEGLNENIIFWMQTVLGQSTETINNKRLMVISQLIKVGIHNQDFNKLMLSKHLFQLLDECLSIGIESVNAGNVLTCLTTCLEAYSTSCGTKKNQVEAYLIQYLYCKTENYGLIKKAAVCFQKLQKIGIAGVDSINYKNNWKTAFEKLCVTLDFLYDTFFDGFEEFYKYEKLAVQPYALPDLPKTISATEMLYVLESRLYQTSLFLRGMLENQYCCVKCIHPQYILDIITRALVVHTCIDKNESDDHFSIILIKNQIIILYLLRSLIAVLELNLIQYSTAISKLLIDCLTRTQKCNCFKHISEYKEVLFKVLEYWIRILGNCFTRNLHEKIIHLIIKDISLATTNITLSIPNTTDTTKKAMSKAMITKIISNSVKLPESENGVRNPFKSKENICYQSLCCLIALLNQVRVCIKDNTFSVLYDTVIQAILWVHTGKRTCPYTSEKVQLKLIECLVAMLELCNAPPSISSLIHILKNGERSSHKRISNISNESLKVLEKICQPICASWTFEHTNVLQSNINKQSVQLNNDITFKDLHENISPEISHDTEQFDTSDDGTLDINSQKINENLVLENIEKQTQSDNENHEAGEEIIHQNNCQERAMSKEISGPNHCIIEEDCAEPMQKKIRINETLQLSVNEMLATFRDEISTSVTHT